MARSSTLLVKVLADGSQATAEFAKMSGHVSSMGQKMQRVGAIMTASVTAPVVGGMMMAVKAASHLNETLSKVDLVFGGSSATVKKWSEGMAKAFGQSKQTALDGASSFAMFGRSTGLAGQDLVQFSTGLTELAGDMASLYDTSPEDAIIAIGAAFRGEMEPIRRYNVLLDDATLRQQAFSMGLVKNTKTALTPQIKVMAAYEQVLKQTGIAHGNFALTSTGVANQERITAAAAANAATSFGELLLPAYQAVLNVTKTVVAWFAKLSDGKKKLILIAAGLAAAIGPIAIVMGSVISVASTLAPILGAIGAPVLVVVAAVAALVAGLVYAYFHFAKFRNTVEYAFLWLKDKAAEAFAFVTQVVTNFLLRYGETFERWKTEFLEIVSSVWAWFQRVVPVALDFVRQKISEFVGLAKRLWAEHGDEVRHLVNAFMGYVRTEIIPTLEAIRNAIGHVLNFIKTLWKDHGDEVVGAVRTAVGAIVKLWKDHGDDVVRFIKAAWNKIYPIVATVLDMVHAVITGILRLIRGDWSGAWDEVKQFVKDAWTAVQKTIEGAKVLVENAFDLVVRAVKGLGSAFWKEAKGLGAEIVRGLLDGIKDMPGQVAGAAKGLAGSAIKAAKGFLGIHSPSKEFHFIGEMVGQGLTDGIVKSTKKSTDAAAKMAKKAAAAAAAEAKKAAQAVADAISDALSSVPGAASAGRGLLSAKRGVAGAEGDLASVRGRQSTILGRIAAAEGKLTAARAKSAIVTASEQVEIEQASEALKQAEQDFADGKITLAAYTVAQERLTRAQAAATEATSDVADAERELQDLRDEQSRLADDEREAVLRLEDAQMSLVDALLRGKEAADKVNAGGEKMWSLFESLARQAGLTTDQINSLARAIDLLPTSKTISINTTGGIGGIAPGSSTPIVVVDPGYGGDPSNTLPSRRIGAYASGGWFPARAGGYLGVIGEGGNSEVVAPEPMLRDIIRQESGGLNVVVNVAGSVMSERDLTTAISDAIKDSWRRNGNLRSDGTLSLR